MKSSALKFVFLTGLGIALALSNPQSAPAYSKLSSSDQPLIAQAGTQPGGNNPGGSGNTGGSGTGGGGTGNQGTGGTGNSPGGGTATPPGGRSSTGEGTPAPTTTPTTSGGMSGDRGTENSNRNTGGRSGLGCSLHPRDKIAFSITFPIVSFGFLILCWVFSRLYSLGKRGD